MRTSRVRTFTTQHALLACALLILAAVIAWEFFGFSFQHIREDIAYHFDHDPADLFAIGERHFDAHDPAQYDLPRAIKFFDRTIDLDPSYPNVHHELGRIAFLKSDFPTALMLMDQEFEMNPNPSPATYYVRALIEGYMKNYTAAAQDYEQYFKVTPANWAGINDYSWVLLEADRPKDALAALEWGLAQWPGNAWLLTNEATALYELGRYSEAKKIATEAQAAVDGLTVDIWLNAYPGNDPMVAGQGLQQFKDATHANLEKILAKAK
jgi:tetratricopeptide (TPR) repeat protein